VATKPSELAWAAAFTKPSGLLLTGR
jgi:hypothetical protein